MKIKTSAGLILATTLFAVIGQVQASCVNPTPGWHMVSKHCHVKPASSWQEYNGGMYLQPVTGFNLLR